MVRLEGTGDGGHGGIRVEAVGTPYAAITTGNGEFSLVVPPGEHTLAFSSVGYGAENVAIPAIENGESTLSANWFIWGH